MKKRIISIVIIIMALILIAIGCISLLKHDTKKETPSKKEPTNETKEETSVEKMKKTLLEYGKATFETDRWLNGNITPATYVITLKDIENDEKYDASIFVNPETKEPCNKERTRIEFIVKEGTTSTHTEYELRPVLICGIKGEVDPSIDKTKVKPKEEKELEQE